MKCPLCDAQMTRECGWSVEAHVPLALHVWKIHLRTFHGETYCWCGQVMPYPYSFIIHVGSEKPHHELEQMISEHYTLCMLQKLHGEST